MLLRLALPWYVLLCICYLHPTCYEMKRLHILPTIERGLDIERKPLHELIIYIAPSLGQYEISLENLLLITLLVKPYRSTYKSKGFSSHHPEAQDSYSSH